MAKRPDISVILVTNDGVVRADFGKDHTQPIFKLRESADVESSFTEAVRHVVVGQTPLALKTIVASTEVWSQIVLLPRMSIGGIDPLELEEALKFEAETLSGIEIDEIVIASKAIGKQDDFEQYWVSAIRQADLDEVNSMLEAEGCRDIVVSHPAGLSGKVQAGTSDISIEIWDGLAYLLSEHSNRLLKVKQFSRSDGSLNAQRILGMNLQEIGPDYTAIEDLGQEGDFDNWAARVVKNFSERLEQLSTPLIRLTKGTTTTPVRHLIAGVIALAVFGFCFWHWNYLKAANNSLLADIVALKEPALEKKRFDSQLISILEQRSEIEQLDSALGNDLKQVRFFLDNQSNRIATLLNLLAQQRTPNLVIQKISGTEQGVMISGISLNGEAAQALAKRLRELATPLGWAVNPAKQEGQQKLTTGGPWDYEIILTDTGPFDSLVNFRKKSVTE